MGIGITLPAGAPNPTEPHRDNTVDLLLAQTRQAADLGLDGVWFSQRFDHDAIAVAGLAGRLVGDIEVGTSVVPIYPRHPIVLASAAKTAQAATHGRFTLGIGLSSRARVESAFGLPYDRPIRHLREQLNALCTLFTTDSVDIAGDTLTARTGSTPSAVPGATPPVPVLVAAMGTQALRVTGELAQGTMPYLCGPRTLADHVVPTITRAAEAAGRPAPRVVALVPGLVPDDLAGAETRAREELDFYRHIPAYQAALAREGVEHPADLALLGDEEHLVRGVRRYLDAGATDVVVSNTGLGTPADRSRTWRALAELSARNNQ